MEVNKDSQSNKMSNEEQSIDYKKIYSDVIVPYENSLFEKS